MYKIIVCLILRKHRYIQKTCIIYLALSDIIMVTTLSINSLETFSHPLINWVSLFLILDIIFGFVTLNNDKLTFNCVNHALLVFF